MRMVLVAVGLGGMVGGVVVAARPFQLPIPLPDGEATAEAACRAPILGAWNRQPPGELALWAVTYGDATMAYQVRFGAGPYCAEAARRRLAMAAGLVAAGLTIGLAGMTRRR